MNILALIGSPRKGGNTDTLVDYILKGALEKGCIVKKIYVYNYKISPCIDCRNCKKGEFVCTIDDDMQNIYSEMETADLIIFGTPLYWYGPTGPMKLLIDRMRPFISNKKLKGKKAIIVVPSEEGALSCGPLIKMFQMSLNYLGMEYIGDILVSAYEKGEIKEKKVELRKAYEFGVNLKI